MTEIVLTAFLGLDVLAWAALGLALLGVVGSLVPLVPGALLSTGGVLLYWWSTGYADPSLPVLVALVSLGLVIVLVDWFAGAISAKVSGAGTPTTVLAGVAGFALFFVAGPVGIFAGVAGVVFLAEVSRTGDPGSSARTAAFTTLGMLASTVAQFLLTGLLFLGFLLAVVL